MVEVMQKPGGGSTVITTGHRREVTAMEMKREGKYK